MQIPSNAIRKSDLYVSYYRTVDSSSRWSSVVIVSNVVPEVAKAVSEAMVSLKMEMKK